MSVWTDFKGNVRIHKDEHFSLEKSFYEVFDEGEITVHSHLEEDNYYTIIFAGDCCFDLNEFMGVVPRWIKMFPSKRTRCELVVTYGRTSF